ncbi:agamous-like MADS-box protein AGL62 [Glycine max]|uniref:agamous-like MADS-box protein AGL62 n=1 Tax=Glycine max TaxID=3847 RepID=UPI001B355584|nr:agamous-like MADS-box protein AGL62 [Glycine max]
MESNNMPDLNGVAKKTKGRQKIEMKKMRKRVTFGDILKRRTGVFKKASELATLCGVDVAGPPPLLTLDLNKVHSTVDEVELHTHLHCLSNQIAIEKKRTKDLNHLAKAAEDQFWWARPIESMTDSQLDKYKKMLEDFKRQLKEKRGNLN